MCIYFNPTECLSSLLYIHMWCVVVCVCITVCSIREAILYGHPYIMCMCVHSYPCVCACKVMCV